MTVPKTLLGLLKRYSPSGEEAGAVNFLVEHMGSLGYSQAYVDEVGNAIGIMGNGNRQVVLLGHIDTVPGEIPVRQEDDLLYGRGSVDAKGPLAAFVDAVAEIGEFAGFQFVVIGAVGEENDSIGARQIVDQFQPAAAIIGEPSAWDRVTLGYKGSAWARITRQQFTAHSAGESRSAAEAVVEDWIRIQKWAEEYNRDHERVFEQVSPTLSSMASNGDGFEETASLDISFRLPLSMTPQMLYKELGKLLEASQFEELGYAIPAHLGDKNNPLVRSFLRAIRQQDGQPRFVRKTGTADMNIVGPVWGCPILAYGPGDSSLDHTPNEHISVEEYNKAVRVLGAVLKSL
ncbi:MAG: [LysW]-lysine hydrolase [Chloroflexi bacterium]|nr:MAG: [LysW]-lysine hydrolase [Chloroflexota bacterium]MBL1193963.1 [LysW]-lysine hydrolase [Chloroflexota bacterium]NOH11258.1 [LysW]-lysine hydrolase [Chloroflexota bacterium]